MTLMWWRKSKPDDGGYSEEDLRRHADRADYELNMAAVCERWPELTPYRKKPVNFFTAKLAALLAAEFKRLEGNK